MATSAGIVLYRRVEPGRIEVLLGHPGGPIWAGRDEGAWSIPKGLVDDGEEPLDAALREFAEETGVTPHGETIPLGSIRLRSTKVVHAWAIEGDMDPEDLVSNTFEMEWPYHSGRVVTFAELDRVGWFDPMAAAVKLNAAQVPLVDRLIAHLRAASDG